MFRVRVRLALLIGMGLGVVSVSSAFATPALPQQAATQPQAYVPLIVTPAPQLKVRIASATGYTGDTFIYIVGEIVNEGDIPAEQSPVIARFYDNNGEVVDEVWANTLVTRTRLGERAPYAIFVENPAPTSVSYELVQAGAGITDVDRYPPLMIVSQQLRYVAENGAQYPEVYGNVRNDQATALEDVRVAITFYDAAGTVVDVALAQPSAGALTPGASVAFAAAQGIDVPHTRYALRGEGFVGGQSVATDDASLSASRSQLRTQTLRPLAQREPAKKERQALLVSSQAENLGRRHCPKKHTRLSTWVVDPLCFCVLTRRCVHAPD